MKLFRRLKNNNARKRAQANKITKYLVLALSVARPVEPPRTCVYSETTIINSEATLAIPLLPLAWCYRKKVLIS